MSERQIFSIHPGQTHSLLLSSPLGSSFTATAEVTVHRLPGGRNSYSYTTAPAASYTVTEFAGDATRGPGWYVTLFPADTETLATGTWLAVPVVTYSSPSAYVDPPERWVLECNP